MKYQVTNIVKQISTGLIGHIVEYSLDKFNFVELDYPASIFPVYPVQFFNRQNFKNEYALIPENDLRLVEDSDIFHFLTVDSIEEEPFKQFVVDSLGKAEKSATEELKPEVNVNTVRYRVNAISEALNEEWKDFCNLHPDAAPLLEDGLAKMMFFNKFLETEIQQLNVKDNTTYSFNEYTNQLLRCLTMEKSKYESVLKAYNEKQKIQGTTRLSRLSDIAPEFLTDYNLYNQIDLQEHPNKQHDSKSVLNDFTLYQNNPFGLGDK